MKTQEEDDIMQCLECEHKNPSEAKFCNVCSQYGGIRERK